MSRLTIDVTEQQHQALKALAALEGKSIKQYALERLFPSDEQQAMQDLKALLQSRSDAAEEGGAVCTFVSFPSAAWEREKRYFTTSIS